MKGRRSPQPGIKVFFIVFVMLELLFLVAASDAITGLLHRWVPFTLRIPDVVWMLIVSVLLGVGLTIALVICFFKPVASLRDAMHKVAKGDFSVRLDEGHGFREIREMRSDFNLMTKELGATQILQTDFISNVSHEFKTPINAIEGYATLLQDSDDLSDSERAQYVDKILLNTGRLSKLAGGVLLLSKLDNQAIKDALSTYSLDEQIRQTVVYLEPRWTARETEFDAELEPIAYTGNEALMQHVWDNLIENAIKFSPRGAMVKLRLFREGDNIVFTAENECDGIGESDIAHIFDRFYQTDGPHRDEGNGLGLALVKEIVTLAGGSIAAENIPGGCRFTVTLPEGQEQ